MIKNYSKELHNLELEPEDSPVKIKTKRKRKSMYEKYSKSKALQLYSSTLPPKQKSMILRRNKKKDKFSMMRTFDYIPKTKKRKDYIFSESNARSPLKQIKSKTRKTSKTQEEI